MKKVSIVTATKNLIERNRKDFFVQMFESIQNQNYANIEHLIVDGASDDGTIDFIKKLIESSSNKNVDIKFISEPDDGLYYAINKGIKKSSGDYILIMNSDDYYYDENSISEIVKTLETARADFACGACLNLETPPRKDNVSYSHPANFVFSMTINHNTMLCKKELFKQFGLFDEKYEIAADYDFLFKLMIAKVKFATTRKIITTFRNTGISCKNKKENREEVLEIMSKFYGSDFPKDLLLRLKKRKLSIRKINEIKIDEPLKSLVLSRMKSPRYILRKYFKF